MKVGRYFSFLLFILNVGLISLTWMMFTATGDFFPWSDCCGIALGIGLQVNILVLSPALMIFALSHILLRRLVIKKWMFSLYLLSSVSVYIASYEFEILSVDYRRASLWGSLLCFILFIVSIRAIIRDYKLFKRKAQSALAL